MYIFTKKTMEYSHTFSDTWDIDTFENISGWDMGYKDERVYTDFHVEVIHGKTPKIILFYWSFDERVDHHEHIMNDDEYLRLLEDFRNVKD